MWSEFFLESIDFSRLSVAWFTVPLSWTSGVFTNPPFSHTHRALEQQGTCVANAVNSFAQDEEVSSSNPSSNSSSFSRSTKGEGGCRCAAGDAVFHSGGGGKQGFGCQKLNLRNCGRTAAEGRWQLSSKPLGRTPLGRQCSVGREQRNAFKGSCQTMVKKKTIQVSLGSAQLLNHFPRCPAPHHAPASFFASPSCFGA